MRDEKIDLFLHLVGDFSFGSTLLDVGGETGINEEFLRLYDNFGEVVVVNLHVPVARARKMVPVTSIIADGCALPFRSQSFDWVFSNAVIEHVGDFSRQKLFSDEIRRVAAKGYFVATPNKYFPIEPHTFLPFYQFLTPDRQRRLVRFAPGYMNKPLQINLLSDRDLLSLFPEAQVQKIGFPALPNNLAAMCMT